MAEFKDAIRSLLPGRLRLRHPMLREMTADDVASLRDLLMGIDGMVDVTINPNVGSALLLWDTSVLSEETLLETLSFYAEMFLASDEAPKSSVGGDVEQTKSTLCQQVTGALDQGLTSIESTVVSGFASAAKTFTPKMAEKNGRRAARVLQNRTMLGLFGGSIAALAIKQTGWHVGLGAAFMALLLIHLQQHKRVL